MAEGDREGPPREVVRVQTEGEAWTLLEELLNRETVVEDEFLLRFQTWPNIVIFLPHTSKSASISPSMMEALIELQRTLYRTHTFLSSNTGDLRNLSKSERERLEFRVEVKSGSSEYDIDLTKIGETLFKEAFTNMSGKEALIAVLGVALLVAGVFVFRTWWNGKVEVRKAELEAQGKKEAAELTKAAIDHDTKTVGLLAAAFQRQPILGEIEAALEPVKAQIVRAIADEGGGRYQGTDIDVHTASEITAQRRQQSQEVRLSGNYRVDKVDTTIAEGFRVTLHNIDTGEDITAVLLDVFINDERRELFTNAEWSKRPLFVELSARRLRNRYIDATVIRVEASKDDAS